MFWSFREWGWRCLPGIIAAGAIALVTQWGGLQPLEQLAYTALFRMRGEKAWDDRVVVIAIDELTLRQLGRFPFRRRYYTQLLHRLSRSDANSDTNSNTNIVVFDLLWSEPHPDDADLAKVMIQHQAVVLAKASDGMGFPLEPVQPLRDAAIAIGHIHKHTDMDGMTRWVIAQAKTQPLFAAVLDTYRLIKAETPLPNLDRPIWVNWLKPTQKIPSYSFVEVLQGKISPKVFHNKIIFVGVTAIGVDTLVTPFNQDPPSYGVYLHATLVNNALQANGLRSLPHLFSLLGLILGPVLSGRLSGWKTRYQLIFSTVVSTAGIGVSLIGLHGNWLMPTATPLLLVISTTACVILQDRLRMNFLLQQQVKRLWALYHSDLVTHYFESRSPLTQQELPNSAVMERVNQLALLAEQFGRSHAAQAAIARSLSLGLLAADLQGRVWFCNPVASQWLQLNVGEELAVQLVPNWVSAEQWQTMLQLLNPMNPVPPIELMQGDRWYALMLEPMVDRFSRSPMLSGFLLVLEDITERKQAAIAQIHLNQQLRERTVQLELVNQELESFSYAVSHDLRAPLRRIDGFSEILMADLGGQIDAQSQDYLRRIRNSVKRMGTLIEDLLNLSQVVRSPMQPTRVNLSELVHEIVKELQQTSGDRAVKFEIMPNLEVTGDARLLRIALENLLSNAWKYTSKEENARIKFGECGPFDDPRITNDLSDLELSNHRIFFVQDNGAGFDMSQSHRLFQAFQRLHSIEEFPGNGVGLMTVRRIIHRHQGRVWVKAAIDEGATLFFSLPHGK